VRERKDEFGGESPRMKRVKLERNRFPSKTRIVSSGKNVWWGIAPKPVKEQKIRVSLEKLG